METSIVIMISFIGWYFATGKFKLPGLFIILGALLAELSEVHRRKNGRKRKSKSVYKLRSFLNFYKTKTLLIKFEHDIMKSGD